MEIVDVVDEKLNVLYPIDKKEAHAKGLLHPTVIAEVINTKGEWLLVKQASDKQDPGQFVSPVGGHVKTKESFENALKREAKEETGIGNFSFRLIGKKIYKRKWKMGIENHYFILYEIYSDAEVVLNEESVEFRRFTVNEIKEKFESNPEFFGKAFHFVIQHFYPSLVHLRGVTQADKII